jgi:DNA mismatch endonuclease (patch repair protein)
VTTAERSRVMRAVKGKNTGPEMLVRRLAHSLGFRFRLHRSDLPGKPDLVFPGRKAIIFVHGCFWHGHGCPRGARVPKANRAYWMAKIGRNVARDAANLKQLRSAGWRVLTLWECKLKNSKLPSQITRFLNQK